MTRTKGDILIVDDTPANLQLLSSMLKEQGYRVRPVPNGKIALRAVESEPPDLILMDINMPVMDGYEATIALKADERFAEIPVIFLSARTDIEDKVKAFQVGGVDYVTKPFQFEEVMARVKAHLDLRRLRQELQTLNQELEERVRIRTEQLAMLNDAYERFVPREFLSFLEKESILDVGLGDQVQRSMTVAFTDIRDFTSLSEGRTPQDNFDFLNTYLGRVTPLIRRHGGFIDKFIGDAVMALFPNSADDAVRGAISLVREVRSLSDGLKASGQPGIRTGTGLHTGGLMLGIIGAEDRFEATVIADAVNTASRLDSLTKLYGVDILMSEDVMQALDDPDAYRHRCLGIIRLQGRVAPVRVYEIFDADEEDALQSKLTTRATFEEGLDLYFERRFAEAAMKFNEVAEISPHDHAHQLYLKRAAHFLGNGAPPDWDGVETMNAK